MPKGGCHGLVRRAGHESHPRLWPWSFAAMLLLGAMAAVVRRHAECLTSLWGGRGRPGVKPRHRGSRRKDKQGVPGTPELIGTPNSVSPITRCMDRRCFLTAATTASSRSWPASAERGTAMIPPHTGHFARRPAQSSLSVYRLPQAQVTGIGMPPPFARDNSLRRQL
jgi:hypothetical protein